MTFRPTVTMIADAIAAQLDGEYDDGLDAFVRASHVGGSSVERMVDLDVSNEETTRFVILIRELE